MKKHKYFIARIGLLPILRLSLRQIIGCVIVFVSCCVLMSSMETDNALATSASILTTIYGLTLTGRQKKARQ